VRSQVREIDELGSAFDLMRDAVRRFLEREGEGIDHYVDHLAQRSPFRQDKP